MNNKGIITGIFLMTATLGYAQKEGEVQNETIIIDKTAKIELVPANRFYDLNKDEQPAPQLKPQQYDTRDYTINPPRFDTKVMIPKMPSDSLEPILPNYIKAGFGNYATFMGEAFLTNKRNSTYSYGLHLKHFSAQKGSLDYAKNSQNVIEAFGTRYGKVNSWNSHISYSSNRYNYYGLPQDVPVNKDTLKQLYQLFHIGVSTNKIKVGDKFNYTTGIDFFALNTTSKASETEILLNLKSSYRLNEEKAVGVDMMLSNANRKDSSSINRTLFMIRPTYNITRDNWDLKVGATINYSSDTLKGSDGVHMYPYAHMDYNLIPGKVMLYGGIGGGMEKNTLRTFVQQNPYLGNNTLLSHTNKKLDLYAGSTGNITDKINYKVQMSYASYTNQFFFTNSATDSSKFTVLYDKANLFAFTGDLFYDLSKEWRISGGLVYNAWNTQNLAKAWHRPPVQTNVGIRYNLKEKIYFNAEMYYISGIQGLNLESNKVEKLKSIADLSLKAEYRFSGPFSAFLEFNNILSQKYQRYLYYQVRGFNILAGLTYSF